MGFILAFFGSVFPAILINVDRKKLFWVGLSGSLGWLASSLALSLTGQTVLSTLAGAITIGAYSEAMARKLKAPATIFSVSGIFPIVPGLGAYTTVQLIDQGNITEAAAKGVETVASAGAIAIGIMLMSAFFRFLTRFNQRKRKFKN